MEWALLPLRKYADFKSRSRRKEFWSFILLIIVVSIAAGMIDVMLGLSTMIGGIYGPVTFLAALVFVIPQFSAGIRRLHDTNRSGWWMLLGFIPVLGSLAMMMTGSSSFALLSLVGLVLIYFLLLDGTRGPNKYGPDPKEVEATSTPAA